MTDTLATGAAAWIVTVPTSGIGRAAALALAAHGAVILVGRDAGKLDAVWTVIEGGGGQATAIVCDLSDVAAAHRAADEIAALGLPLAGLLNNAGIHEMRATRTAPGWDRTFATNVLGPLALTDALVPHLPDGATILFVASATEDPERRPARMAGFRGGRYISAVASARGEWAPGGSTMPGADAYATSKQAVLAIALELAREQPRLRVNAVEPGFTPATALGRDASPFLRFLLNHVLARLAPVMRYWSTPRRTARVIATLMLNEARATGVYFDDGGNPMRGSERSRDRDFTRRVLTETRALLAAMPVTASV